ncbi:MAG: hypothetical protein RSD44_09120 [Akkermansia sp.]
MKITLLILLILAGGAGIYLSLEQKSAYEAMINHKQELRAENIVRTNVLHETESSLEDMTKQMESWLTKRSENQALVKTESQKNKELSDKLVVTTKGNDEKRAEIQKLMDELAQYNISDPQELVDMVAEMKKSNDDLKTQIEEVETLLMASTKKVSAEEIVLNNLQKDQKEFRDQSKINSKEFSVVQVDPEWGFVVVNAGDSNKLAPDAILLVTRQGRSIAKLKISSLEKRQTIADVIPNSLAAGNRVEPGDRVILLNPKA